SGHESFKCRELWLKKGFDFVNSGKFFKDLDAVVELGVGKNMVSAIQYWMTAFNTLDSEKKLTDFSRFIFSEDGKDPFIEDIATLCLLHYFLVKINHASIYYLFFNEFRKEKSEFTRTHLVNYLKRKCEEHETSVSDNTIERDVGVFLSTYMNPDRVDKDSKDLSAGLLVDLGMIGRINKIDADSSVWFRVLNTDKEEIPAEILLFCILDNENYGNSISLHDLVTANNSIGSVFSISTGGIVKKIEELTVKYKWLTYMDDAGIKEVQFKDKIDKWEVLDNYYGK
ncbi:MAG TPA: DUF4007 family protein, partial [Patescibacteria group bacterium]|nr:DUF4007 family protein [Patescibacteria group bacterium]